MAGQMLGTALLGSGVGVLGYEGARNIQAMINGGLDPAAAEAGHDYGRRSPVDLAMLAVYGLTGGLAGAGMGNPEVMARAVEATKWQAVAEEAGVKVAQAAAQAGMSADQAAEAVKTIRRPGGAVG